MNRKRIAIISAAALAIFIFVFIFKGIMLKRSKRRIEMTAKRIDTIFEYANTHLAENDLDRAKKAFEMIEKEESAGEKRADAMLKIAEIYEKKNNLITAKEYYKKFIETFPAAEYIGDVQRKLEEVNMNILFSPIPTETSIKYEIKRNDALIKIARKYNTTVELLKRSNDIEKDIIIPGRFLKVERGKFSVLVDKSQNLLFLKKNGEIMKTYKVATGGNNSTPVGDFKIEEKLISPPWYKVGAIVPANSPKYELGARWMGLSVSGYGIHGTKDPGSIGKQITKGCVRMINADVIELYGVIPSGTEVVIVD